jgi:hypothetical protein
LMLLNFPETSWRITKSPTINSVFLIREGIEILLV